LKTVVGFVVAVVVLAFAVDYVLGRVGDAFFGDGE
jgi:preprotein translocase subunit SecE